ncbi:MAG: AAA family ATPase [Myxococcota bacterium]
MADGPKLLKPPAEVVYAKELKMLEESDDGPRPPGWRMSPKAVRSFILGDKQRNIRRKFVAHASLVDRAMVALATNRGLMLVGEPGTAKSMLSELLAAAICGDSTLTIQGGAATTEDQIKYSWNYALLISEGPSKRSLVPAPLFRAMEQGKIVRFEEITRCPPEVQDSLLSILSDKVMAIGELEGEESMLFAHEGFNMIATANTRDRGVNEMSAALKRRLNFETVFPIPDFKTELALVKSQSSKMLEEAGVPMAPPEPVLEVLVRAFRELRTGESEDGATMDRLSSVMSTAEAVSVAFSMGVRSYYIRDGKCTGEDLVHCLAGAAVKDNLEDLKKLRRYIDQRAGKRSSAAWQEVYEARTILPE